VLDWGCGPADYRTPIERLGHRYVGVDSEGGGADVLADVHSLPLASDSLDHVVTNAVLEHVANPFLAISDVSRVLKRGGVFSGSVAFLEPHHAESRFHLTAAGVVDVLTYAGLEVRGIWPQEGWLVFDSLATMHGPVSWPSRRHPRDLTTGRWLKRKTPAECAEELLTVAGQIDFVATKTGAVQAARSGRS
jgi:SAM-dependent methyltransferase